MAHQITLEDAATRLPELIREAQGGSEIVLLDGHRPVAKLTPLDDAPSSHEIAALAMAGGAFDWLADEPDLYDDDAKTASEVRERLLRWQQEYGLPSRPDGEYHTSLEALFEQWNAEDASLTPEEADAGQQIWEEHQQNHQSVMI